MMAILEEVAKQLKEQYNIEETVFVGDRGMITKLNLERLISNGYDYIMGVKTKQDEIVEMIMSGENSQVEFKTTMRYDMRENKVNKKLEEVILNESIHYCI